MSLAGSTAGDLHAVVLLQFSTALFIKPARVGLSRVVKVLKSRYPVRALHFLLLKLKIEFPPSEMRPRGQVIKPSAQGAAVFQSTFFAASAASLARGKLPCALSASSHCRRNSKYWKLGSFLSSRNTPYPRSRTEHHPTHQAREPERAARQTTRARRTCSQVLPDPGGTRKASKHARRGWPRALTCAASSSISSLQGYRGSKRRPQKPGDNHENDEQIVQEMCRELPLQSQHRAEHLHSHRVQKASIPSIQLSLRLPSYTLDSSLARLLSLSLFLSFFLSLSLSLFLSVFYTRSCGLVPFPLLAQAQGGKRDSK